MVAAKVERLSIAFGVERGCFIHGHAADGVFGHGFRFFHGHVPFHKQVVNLRLFIGQFGNHDDQQDHQQYADQRIKPHPSAHPAIHPSVYMIHHKAPFVIR
jgi:hypothetical protein